VTYLWDDRRRIYLMMMWNIMIDVQSTVQSCMNEKLYR